MTEHEKYREWVGAYLLGALEPAERSELEGHLAGCEPCRAEVVALAPLPGLLRGGGEPAAVVVDGPATADAALSLLARDRGRLERRLRRWRAGAAAALAAVLVLAGATAWLAAVRDGSEPSGSPPDPRSVAALAVDGDASGEVRLTARGWGVSIEAELADLPEHPIYELWVVAGDGSRQLAASWGPTGQRRARLWGSSSVDLESVTAVEIWSGATDELIGTASADT